MDSILLRVKYDMTVKIKDIIKNISFKKAPIGSFPYLEIGDVNIHTKKYEIKPKTSVTGAVFCPKDVVIVSKVRPSRGAVSLTLEEIVTSSAFVFLDVNSKMCLPKYLFYRLAWNNDFFSYLSSKATGATYPTVKEFEVLNYSLGDLPSIKEQEQLIIFFEEAESLKNKRLETNQETESLAISLFIKMFGDPASEETKYRKIELDKLGKWKSGRTPLRSNPLFFKGTINWYTTGELNDNYLLESKEKITEKGLKNISDNLFKKGSLVVGMYDTAALKLGILPEDSMTNQACAVAYLDEKIANKMFILEQLKIRRSELMLLRRGIRQQNLNLSIVKSIKVILPPIELQNKYTELVKEIQVQKNKQIESTQEIDELFNTVLSKSFS